MAARAMGGGGRCIDATRGLRICGLLLPVTSQHDDGFYKQLSILAKKEHVEPVNRFAHVEQVTVGKATHSHLPQISVNALLAEEL